MMSTMEADEAWCPPTLMPLGLVRPRWAASTIAAESQSTLWAMARRVCSSTTVRVEAVTCTALSVVIFSSDRRLVGRRGVEVPSNRLDHIGVLRAGEVARVGVEGGRADGAPHELAG